MASNSSISSGVRAICRFSSRMLGAAHERAPASACACMSFSNVSRRSACVVRWSNRPALMISSAISIFCCWITFRTTDSTLSAYSRAPPVPHVRSSKEKDGRSAPGGFEGASSTSRAPHSVFVAAGAGDVDDGFEVDAAHLPLLPDAVRARHRLLLVLGVRVRVVHHHGIRALQVQPPPGGADGEQKQKLVRTRRVELRNGRLAVVQRGAAVDAAPFQPGTARRRVSAPFQIHLQQIEQLGHGGEQKHSVPGSAQLHQQPVEHPQLAARAHQRGAVAPVPPFSAG